MPSLCSSDTHCTSLRGPSDPSALIRNLGTMNSEMPFTPSGAVGQERAQIEGHVRGMPHLLDRSRNELRQALTAELGILGEAVPAVGAILQVRVLETRGGLHRAVVETPRAFAVADRVQRIENFGRELGRFGENRGDGVGRRVLEARQLADLLESRQLVHHELHFPQWRAIWS